MWQSVDTAVVKKLLAAGARVEIEDKDKRTPIGWAKENIMNDMQMELLRRGDF